MSERIAHLDLTGDCFVSTHGRCSACKELMKGASVPTAGTISNRVDKGHCWHFHVVKPSKQKGS